MSEKFEIIRTSDDQYVKTWPDRRWDEFLNKELWFDWPKIMDLKSLYILIITQIGVGKTFGITHYSFQKGWDVAFLINTAKGVDTALSKLLGALKLDFPEEYEGWFLAGDKIFDDRHNLRCVGAGVGTYASVKGARDFLPQIIVYDEFNQNVKFAEQKDTRVLPKIETIMGRWKTKNHQPKHVFLFGNKDGNIPLNSVSVLTDLGLWSFNGLHEVSELYDLWKDSSGKDYEIPLMTIINPVFSENERMKIIDRWLQNPKKYAMELSSVRHGDGKTTFFNEDSRTFDESVRAVIREGFIKILKLNAIFYDSGNYLFEYVFDLDASVEDYEGLPFSMREFQFHYRTQKAEPILSQGAYISTWNKVEKENYKIVATYEKINMRRDAQRGIVSFENVASRMVYFKMINKS